MGADWTALAELGGTPTTRASAGHEARAAGIQALVREAHAYLSDGLGTDFAPLVVVATPADWAHGEDEAPPYGIPYASDEALELVVPADLAESFLVDLYAEVAPRADAERFADLIAVHELGHLHARELGLDLPAGWLCEFVATYLAACFLVAHRPDDATLWYAVARAHAAASHPAHRTLEELDELYFDVGPANYIWYQDTLTVMVERVQAARGLDFALRLREAGLGPDSDGPAMLAAAEAVHPGFAAWAASLRDDQRQ